MKTSFLALAAAPALLLHADEPPPRDYQDAKTEVPLADEDLARPPSSDVEPSAKDIETLAKLHHDNEMEVKLGKLARQSGGSKRVKAYGDVLVRDHTLADKQVRSFAKRNGIDLALAAPKDADELAEREAAMDSMKRLETLTGEAFDRELVQLMIGGHTAAVDLVETTRSQTESAKVHALLTRLLPVFQDHLKLAESIKALLQNV